MKQHPIHSGSVPDVEARKHFVILHTQTSKDQYLVSSGNTLLVLNFPLHVCNAIATHYFKSNDLASQRPQGDLKTTTQTQHQVQGGLLLDVVVREGSALLQLLTSKDQSLLVGGNTLLVLNFRLHVFNGIASLYFKSNGLACKCLHEDLHFGVCFLIFFEVTLFLYGVRIEEEGVKIILICRKVCAF